MQVFEFEGKTTEDAITAACRQLELAREEMEVEVVEPGSAGIFGLVGGRKAKIRVSIRTVEPPQPEDDFEKGLSIARETLETILQLIPMEGTQVKAAPSDGAITLNIEGDRSGLLIGRKGRTLDALQYVVHKIVNKTLSKRTQVIVDVEDYRQRRKDSLIQMSLRMGDKAKRIGKPVTTNPLSPRDRRIVHLALQDDKALDTKSRGEGLMKKVLIIPKRELPGKDPDALT